MPDLSTGLLWYVAFIFSTTCHEAAHAFAAYKMGDSTAYEGGQVSLDPIPHIKREPFGMILVPIILFVSSGWLMGWASTPFDPAWAHKHPKRSSLMALAGPLANLSLLLIAAGLIHLGIFSGVFHAPEQINFSHVVTSYQPGLMSGAAMLLSVLFTLNLILFAFNLIPLPPLDGSSVLGLFMDDDQARNLAIKMKTPMFSMAGLLVAWYLFPMVFSYIHLFALNLLYPGAGYH